MKKYLRYLTFLLLIVHYGAVSQESNVKVVFINPGSPEVNATGDFWRNVSFFMQDAADDLKIELVTIYACRDHILMKSFVDKVLSHQPDYVVLVNEKGVVVNMVKQLAARNVPIFFLLNGLNEQDISELTKHERALIKGSVVPDNFSVGKKLLEQLTLVHKANDPHNGVSNLLALQGDFTTPASLERERGFKQAVAEHKQQFRLIDSSVANWSKAQAYQKIKGLLQRNRIDTIWAANDAMAFGAKQAVQEAKLHYPVTIGGVNWDINDQNYPLDVSFGGHVTLGAYAMVMLADIAQNRLPESKRHQTVNIFESTKVPYYKRFVERLATKQFAPYDFTVFSHANSQALTFTLENLDSAFVLDFGLDK